MISGNSVRELVLPTEIETLWVLPSDKNLAGIEIEFAEDDDRGKKLKAASKFGREYFHYMIVDCPPSLGILTVNGLTAADSLLGADPVRIFRTRGCNGAFRDTGAA